MDRCNPPQDLEARRPVWDALSTLFLDTELSLLRDHRARLLAESPYTLEELDQILRDEVFSVCSLNQASIAGEWLGFDPDWLEAKIVERLAGRRRFRIGFGHRLFLRSREWRRTKRRVAELRRTKPPDQDGAASDHSD